MEASRSVVYGCRMISFRSSVIDFLNAKGFHCEDEIPGSSCNEAFEVIKASSEDGKTCRKIILVSTQAESAEEAESRSLQISKVLQEMDSQPVIISEDRWNRQREISQARILAHLEIFFPIYARNCEVRKIDKKTAADFLEKTHSYGHATCRYCYGLFLKRHTEHIAAMLSEVSDTPQPYMTEAGSLVGVASFSNARKWAKGDKIIRSYEWTRYASLPHLRVIGGMGRILKAFIKDVQPDDIMSYADLEWSEGKVYEQLGFTLEGYKAPVCFRIDTEDWSRNVLGGQKCPPPCPVEHSAMQSQLYFFQNFGSAKYRLKLTEYE